MSNVLRHTIMRPRVKLWRGVLGGIVGSYLMRLLVQKLDQIHGNRPEFGAFGLDREADSRSLQFAAQMILNKSISEEKALRLAALFHYAYGALGGLAYVAIFDRYSSVRWGRGTLFGASIWLLGDEIPIACLGISDPFRKAPASHAYALLAHLLYGVSVEISALGSVSV